jgi:uncharacterized protein YwgA
MKREELLLAIFAAAGGRPYSPVQIQKAVFLVTRNLPRIVTEGEKYSFEPYDYGPFDRRVYNDAETLASQGLVEISQQPGTRWKRYSASDAGLSRGKDMLDQIQVSHKTYIESVSNWIRSLSFEQLVKAIYEAYPDTKVNSIFRG